MSFSLYMVLMFIALVVSLTTLVASSVVLLLNSEDFFSKQEFLKKGIQKIMIVFNISVVDVGCSIVGLIMGI